MEPTIPITFDNRHGEGFMLDKYPDECPFCHQGIIPTHTLGGDIGNDNIGRVFLRCVKHNCRECFIAYYEPTNFVITGGYKLYKFTHTSIGKKKTKEFHKSIFDISPSFVEIYNQAFSAEQYNLMEVCGVGYRKALEFLIKDFAIKNNPEGHAEAIKIGLLGRVIKDYIKDDIGSRIKIVASKAVWIGNDETHYVRKWEDKDLNDLKSLIDLTLTMIQADSDFKELQKSMPD